MSNFPHTPRKHPFPIRCEPHRGRRLVRLGFATGLAVLPLAVLASPAAAVGQIAAVPAVHMDFGCNSKGPFYTLTYTNDAPTDSHVPTADAFFSTSIQQGNAIAEKQDDVSVAAQAQFVAESGPLTDGVIVYVLVTATGMTDFLQSFVPDCFEATGTVTASCVNGAPTLSETGTNTGLTPQDIKFQVDGVVQESVEVDPAASHTYTQALVEGAAYHAEVLGAIHGTYVVVAELSATASCTAPAVVGQLPETGSASTSVIVMATLLTVLGLGACRLVRRPVA